MITSTRKKFLICDGNPDVRSIVKEAIHTVFPRSLVVEAQDGMEATQKTVNQKFDLVIADVKLPKRDGIQLVSSFGDLEEHLRPTKVLMLSDSVSEALIHSTLGKVGFLAKPCSMDQVKEALLKCLPPQSEKKPAASQSMNVEIINPFIDATLNVLSTTAQTQAKKETVFIRKGDHISGDISALVAITSPTFHGSMAISFESACFLAVVSKMLGENYTEITLEISDAAGELCNQIFGLAKSVLNQKGLQIQPAIPSVITGKKHHIQHLASGPVIAVQFTTSAGHFCVEACVTSRKADST